MIPKADRMSFAVFTPAKRVVGQKPRSMCEPFSRRTCTYSLLRPRGYSAFSDKKVCLFSMPTTSSWDRSYQFL